jgi:preprotein translocase subunit YajC
VNGSIVLESLVSDSGLLAQATAPSLLESPMVPIFVIILILWVLMFRSKRRDDRKKKDLLEAVKRGDRVQTIGGVFGNVVQVEKEKILLKVDESTNTKIWFSRNAIFRVIGEEKAEPAGKEKT